MKKLLYILTLLFSISFVNANETEEFIVKAKESKTNNDYKQAIKFFVKALKECDSNEQKVELYFEVADCYYQLDNKRMSVLVIEEAIVKLGITKMDILEKTFTNNKTNYFLIDNIKNYNKLRQKFISNLDDIDSYLRKETFLVKL